MPPTIHRVSTCITPEALAKRLSGRGGVMLLQSACRWPGLGRHSLVVAEPMLRFRSRGSRCELWSPQGRTCQYGNPWSLLESLMARYELVDQADLPFPLGGCFGVWGYDLRGFLEPRLARPRAVADLGLPDCDLGFYDSLVVFDHLLGSAWVVSTGLGLDGSRCDQRARRQAERWCRRLEGEDVAGGPEEEVLGPGRSVGGGGRVPGGVSVVSSMSRDAYLRAVQAAQRYIRLGHIYQVNLAHRLVARWTLPAGELFRQLADLSPAPFAAWLDFGDYQLASSSPELFLRMSGSQVLTQPIKGTRPRGADAVRDAQLGYELQTSPKERSELLMITDLLRNDLGRVCEYGSVTVPDLMRLERFAQVQHLISTVEGRLRAGTSHFEALAACFPGGSITGAPKIRAMEIIDELEPVARGPYTGALGYLGFNRESQLSMVIRTACLRRGQAFFHTGAGIVADSDPASEYQETLDKARAFLHLVGAAVPAVVPGLATGDGG